MPASRLDEVATVADAADFSAGAPILQQSGRL